MATVITFPGSRQASTPDGVNPELAATMAEHRALMQSFVADMLVQYQTQRLGPAATSIWRPERPLTSEVRDRLHGAWYTGLRYAEAAVQLANVAIQLAALEWETGGKSWSLRKQTELEKLIERVSQREVWRQFNLAPRGKDGLAWKRKHLLFLEDQTAGKLIIAADEAWLERINGAISRAGRSRGRSTS